MTTDLITDHPILPPELSSASAASVVEYRDSPSVVNAEWSDFATVKEAILHVFPEGKLNDMAAPLVSQVCESIHCFRYL